MARRNIRSSDNETAPEPEQETEVQTTAAPEIEATSPAPEAGLPDPQKVAVPGSDPSKVEKKTVKTSGDFMLMDPWTGTHILADSEGTEVVVTTFIQQRLDNGDLVEA